MPEREDHSASGPPFSGALAGSLSRVARLLGMTHDTVTAQAPDIHHVAELADQLAARLLSAIKRGELTIEEFRNRPEVALILRTATMLQELQLEFPPNIRRLGTVEIGSEQP